MLKKGPELVSPGPFLMAWVDHYRKASGRDGDMMNRRQSNWAVCLYQEAGLLMGFRRVDNLLKVAILRALQFASVVCRGRSIRLFF